MNTSELSALLAFLTNICKSLKVTFDKCFYKEQAIFLGVAIGNIHRKGLYNKRALLAFDCFRVKRKHRLVITQAMVPSNNSVAQNVLFII